MKKKIIDLFCGCGGLSLGFEQAGFEVAYAIDMWDKAIMTYNHIRPMKPLKQKSGENLSWADVR